MSPEIEIPENQMQRLELRGLARGAQTHGGMRIDTGLTRCEVVCRSFALFWTQKELCI